ncbi:MAG: ribosomal-processing cysteine protease Prp [Clostridia bacterium]|nr:ribosomal-processing cysteine protease Prp [Clostridia bacterium]
MTTVTLWRTDKTNGVDANGHQDGAPAGQNLYCAAVSAMCMMLLNALKAEGAAMVRQEIESGHVVLEAERTPRTDAFFDMLDAGMKSMVACHPGKVRLLHTNRA